MSNGPGGFGVGVEGWWGVSHRILSPRNLILQSDTIESKSRVYFARMKVKSKLICRSLKPNRGAGQNPLLLFKIIDYFDIAIVR